MPAARTAAAVALLLGTIAGAARARARLHPDQLSAARDGLGQLLRRRDRGPRQIASCLAGLAADLPDPSTATSKKSRRTATKLHRRYQALGKVLTRAGASTGKKQTRLYAKARRLLQALVTVAGKANAHGTLGAPLAALQAAAADLAGRLP